MKFGPKHNHHDDDTVVFQYVHLIKDRNAIYAS
jgi:hypothetical protein